MQCVCVTISKNAYYLPNTDLDILHEFFLVNSPINLCGIITIHVLFIFSL